MKKLIQISFIFLLAPITYVNAQDVGGKTLVSQSRTTQANIGGAEIKIDYHSPSVNGRKIFGGIVPFNFVVDGVEYPWRAGSNQRTTMDFSHDVMIEGNSLPAGTYGFLILVNEAEWTLIFSSGKSWGAFNYDQNNDVLRIPVQTQQVPFQEWLSYDYINPTSETIDIQLRWERTAVTFTVSTNALSNLLFDLNEKEDKTAADYQSLSIRTLEKDPGQQNEALSYLEQSKTLIAGYEVEAYRKAYLFNYKILKGELLMTMGKNREGNTLIKEALDSAQGFNIYYYALNKMMVKGDRKGAFNILNEAIKKMPENFQNHFAFGEYYLQVGNQKKATEHFKKAYEMTVEQDNKWQNYAKYLYLQNQLITTRN